MTTNPLIQVSAAALFALTMPMAVAQTAEARAAWPGWLRTQIEGYESLPFAVSPSSIWRLTRQGQPAYFVVAPCCDQFNPLLGRGGERLCSPSGGITGAGDGRCPDPADPGTPTVLVWIHPGSPMQTLPTPQLGRR